MNNNIISGLFLLICAFSIQYWIYRCCNELKEIKEELRRQGQNAAPSN